MTIKTNYLIPIFLFLSITAFLFVSANTYSANFSTSPNNNKNTSILTNQRLNNKKVLVLHSYHKGYNWTDKIMTGINSVINDKNIELFVNYMDTKHCSNDDYFKLLYQIYKEKYSNVRFDAILSSDDHALNFLLQYKDELFPGVPLVFCGINDFHPERIKNYTNVTGTYETYDILSTLKLIHKLHPNVSSLAVINDSTVSGQAFINRVKRAEKTLQDTFKINYISNLPLHEIQTQLSALPSNSAVVWGIYLRTPEGKTLTYQESVEFTRSSTKLPVYCIWDVVGSGVIGGKITNPVYQGEKASELVLQILKGKKAKNLAVSGSPMVYKFDNNILQEHHISESELPAESIIINKNHSIYEQYKNIIWIVIIIITILVLIIITLSHLLKKINSTSKVLQLTNKELALAKDKAEESDRLKTSFLANLSHEIRTPMNGIIGFSELLAYKNITPEKHHKYLKLIKSSSQRMLNLINNLIDISIIETKQMNCNIDLINLQDVMTNMYQFFLPSANKKGLLLTYENKLQDDSFQFNSDKQKLEQIITNLVMNAIKFTKSGKITLSCEKQNGKLYFLVEDTGIGIDKNLQDAIFERFRRNESTTTRTEEGSGLGLAISKSLVEMMDGEIGVQSEINKGSKFYFTLPIR